MPDYNKGDFTQQGIDGFVEGGLHLNEKRCLTARISTDEEAEGLDSVEINIHDHLNDLDYTITGENLTVGENVIGGSGGRLATVEFEENGTYLPSDYEVYGFGEVTVNVPGGDTVPLLTVEFSSNAPLSPASIFYEYKPYSNGYLMYPDTVQTGDTLDFLYTYDEDDYYVEVLPQTGITVTDVTDTVNCEYDGAWITIIDPTLNSSCTIVCVVSGGGGGDA